MIPTVRRKKILSLMAKRDGVMSIADLCKLLNVSHMTVRRDIQILEQNNLVHTVTGGVQLPEKLFAEPSHQTKTMLAAEEKDRIGREAAKLVKDSQCIYLDAGTTCLALAHYIIGRKNLTVVTNDFEIANYLIAAGTVQLIHVGGVVRCDNKSSVGMLAARTIRALNMDLAFISASSWDLKGLTTPDPQKVDVKVAAVEAAMQSVFVCDSTKYSKVAAYRIFDLEKFNIIITDRGLQDIIIKQIENKGVSVITV